MATPYVIVIGPQNLHAIERQIWTNHPQSPKSLSLQARDTRVLIGLASY